MSSHPPSSSIYPSVPKPRKTAQISAALDHRLAAYALVAGVAGVSTAAFAQAAPENTIQYTPASIPFAIPAGGHGLQASVNIDLNGDGITDMKIKVNGGGFSTGVSYSYYGIGYWSAPRGNGGVTRPLGSGIEIGPVRQFGDSGRLALCEREKLRNQRHPQSGCYGPFNNRTAYLGVSFLITGEIHYGWIRLSLNADQDFITGTVTGYAYNIVPNAPMEAGQTQSGKPVKEDAALPKTLGMLSLGSAEQQ
jgi:hypothetical protein